MSTNNPNDFFNFFGEMAGAFAREFGTSNNSGSTNGNGAFFDKLSGWHKVFYTAYYNELLNQGFSEDQAKRLIEYMSDPTVS